MKTSVWLAMGIAASIQPVLGNGGGYFRGGVERAGDVAGFEPAETAKIRIVDEKLTVDLGAAAAEVEVRYLMRNETGQKVKARFGFPVEESFDRNDFAPPEEQGPAGKTKLKYCRNYAIAASGKPVAASWQEETKPSADKRFAGIAGWLVSQIEFAPGEEKPVSIRFRSGYPLSESSVSESESTGSSIFKYRLSTAAVWAGTIGTGRITLRPAGISADDLKVLKPVNRFKKSGGNWVWDFTDLEPTLADDLEIEAQPAKYSTPVSYEKRDGSRYVSRGDRWSMSHVNYQVTASSTLPASDGHAYDAGNVKNGDPDSVWSEGAEGPGIGEWLELKPEVAKPLDAIEMDPGFFMNDELFHANARPKKVRVELNGGHAFTVSVPDERTACRIPVEGYGKPVKTIRLTFLEVWPGTKFEDMCVSGIRLHVRLDKKPKLEPVR
jgi:hypothetical protein